ncbi:TldD/PmbA family protein [Alicyclobacillus ferrooxydans]|uniref:Peptidase C69 n=1 Tax=Alicyclobacillus ferrooxydans TaxID=471514 RepID=A0A0P9CRP8_9BACL|nr:TldD/PmbA family protein [Alicyclobacillus ferrooxydans]KPV42182.1 peptidase C69 [Alicyclobacillus ferrooxydans]
MISQSLINAVLDTALSTGGDFAEVFVEDRTVNRMGMRGGIIENSLSGRDFGVGIRVFKGLGSAYAYTTDATPEGLHQAARRAASGVRGLPEMPTNATVWGDTTGCRHSLCEERAPSKHLIERNPQFVQRGEKAQVMREAYDIAKNYHSSITQVSVGYMDEEQKVLIANSDGKWIQDVRIRSRLSISSIASDGNKFESGFYGPGAHKGFEFIAGLDLEHYAGEASRIAVTRLSAVPCPSGKFPVVIDNEFGGVIFHEACGHGLEATSVAKGNSVFANRIGEKVASDVVTYIDDGTLENEWGSLAVDDEGEPTRRNVLIQNGVLKGYLIDRFNSRRMNMPPTGSGRRQSYRFAPTSRMTNTYIANGSSTPKEIIENTEQGIYAKYLGGGQVNTATGDYNFAVMEAYLIENGKITTPLKGATLIGNGPKTLQLVDMVGNNLGHGQGMCGSLSGSIPVNVGQPTLRVSEMTVGGTREGA